MKRVNRPFLILSAVFLAVMSQLHPSSAQNRKFDVVEASIADIHQAIRSGRITCRQLVMEYQKRINTYDQSTRLNAIVVLNPEALADADKLDQEFKRTGKLRPLHGVPIIVKDNYDTKGLQTTGGSLAMKGFLPD